MTDPMEELLLRLKGKNVRGYYFGFQEFEDKTVASLTNSITRKLINLDRLGPEVTLGYSLIKDKIKGTSEIFKCEVVRKESSVSVIVRDLATDKIISETSPSVSVEDHHIGSPDTDTTTKCQQDFLCKYGGEIQCEANRTCQDQWYSLICWFDQNNGVSIHAPIRPNTLRCQIMSNIPSLEGIVISRKA
jgi:hypothetical protein